jgi:hypothetical protein
MFLKCLIATLAVFYSKMALAQFEEYGYFSESEINEVNTPLLLDSEYFSDILTYRMPFSMHANFLRSDRVFDLSIGSLSRSRFATQYRLKIDTKLNSALTFRLAYAEQKDFEQSINHSILELQYRLNSFLSLVGYTELKSEKKWNDIGTALLFDFEKNHSLRLYVAWMDFSFNKRTENNESDSRSSVAYGFVGRLLDDENSSFLEYYARVQSPLSRNLESGANYAHRDSKLGVRGTQVLSTADQQLHFDVSYKYRTEGIQQTGSTDRTNGFWRSHSFDSLLQYEYAHWTFGVLSVLRDWEINNEKIKAQTHSPHIWYDFNANKADTNQFRVGYEVSFHSISGSADLRTPPDRNKDVEHRGNLRYTIYFNENAFLHLYFTADLDDQSWEGGNGTFQILF